MPSFTPVAFPVLLRRMRREVELSGAIFDLPVRRWFFPTKEFDFSASHFSHRASAPVGPAAGPHTQLAQNLVQSWLVGGRILELKTVQVNDQLEIPRPCIHVPNIGYNIEWSQELRVRESLREYVKAVYLIEVLKQTRAFGEFADASGFDSGIDTTFDISVGYDLAGIQAEPVTSFLQAMRNSGPPLEELRRELRGELDEFRELELPASISDCVTLSTFHGCPAREIEAIVRYLLELGFHTVIKFNPTLLGFEAIEELLVGRLGYCNLTLCREAFEQDLQYHDALEMFRRLHGAAEDCGLTVGAKFTNTLVVANNPTFFPTQTQPYMYLSGAPLHVIAMNLMQRFREDIGFEFPVSFSAGIDRTNFPAAVACGMVPVTTCTDLLRQGGYGRLPRYLGSLAEEMQRCGVTRREDYVLAAHGHSAQAIRESLQSAAGGAQVWNREGRRLAVLARERPSELPRGLRDAASDAGLDAEAIVLQATRIAGRLNGRTIVPMLADDPRYHARANQKEPTRVARSLRLYDCINCDLCITACPNDAIFAYEATVVDTSTELICPRPGSQVDRKPGVGFRIRNAHQLAVVGSLCNECSNCEVYCPEGGAPFKLKERVFLTLDDFRACSSLLDGACCHDGILHLRFGGSAFSCEPEPGRNRAVVHGEGFRLDLSWEPFEVRSAQLAGSEEVNFDTALLWRMKTVWGSIFNSRRPNFVNPDPAVRSSVLPAGETTVARSRP